MDQPPEPVQTGFTFATDGSASEADGTGRGSRAGVGIGRDLEAGRLQAVAERLLHSMGLRRPLAFLDLEATGIDTRNDRVLELSIARVEPDGKLEFRSWLINPGRKIPPASTRIHGISDAEVATAPSFGDISNEVATLMEDCDLGGYNLRRFDLPMLRAEFSRCGRGFDWEKVNVIDVYTIFCKRERRDLSSAYRFYCDRQMSSAHSAAADMLVSMEVLAGQFSRYDDLPREAALLQEFCRDPEWADNDGRLLWRAGELVFAFGKHAGTRLATVATKDRDYLYWMLDSDFPPSTVKLIEGALEGRIPPPPGPPTG